jgi:bifunctional DNA-binding transcriptional regulator/antitoxin component of YhaV-PrlF toxin-antitoxin module
MDLIRKLQKTNKDQYTLTIPKNIVQLLNWKDKDEIEFGMEKGKITITKAKGKKGDRSA